MDGWLVRKTDRWLKDRQLEWYTGDWTGKQVHKKIDVKIGC